MIPFCITYNGSRITGTFYISSFTSALASIIDQECAGRKLIHPIFASVFPANSLPYKLCNIDKPKQYRNLNQWPDSRGQRLIAVSTKCCDRDSDSKLEVVAGCGPEMRTTPES